MDAEGTTAPKGPNLVRPYFLTKGRTQADVELPIEATVQIQPSARKATWPAGGDDQQDHRALRDPAVRR